MRLALVLAVVTMSLMLYTIVYERIPPRPPPPLQTPKRSLQWMLDYDLALAAASGDFEQVRALLDRGAMSESKYRIPIDPPLHGAARQGHLEVVRLLVDRGADLFYLDDNWMSALHLAASSDHPELVRYLLQEGKGQWRQLARQVMVSAARFGHSKVVEVFLQQGVETDLKEDGTLIEALEWAASTNQTVVVELLINYGVDLHGSHPKQSLALFTAIEGGHTETVELLFRKGAKPSSRLNGLTPLEFAQQRGNKKMIALVRRYSRR